MNGGQWAATTEFKLNYLAAVKKGKPVAESTVMALGSRTAVVRVEVENEGRSSASRRGALLVSEPPAAKADRLGSALRPTCCLLPARRTPFAAPPPPPPAASSGARASAP